MPNDDRNGEAQWTVLKTLRWTSGYFERHSVENPRADAEVLLAHTLKCERIDLYLRYDQPLNEDELLAFKQLIKRRIDNEPVAYIVGSKEFWSLHFFVAPGVLIPRPDTECLVETALKFLPREDKVPSLNILELGAGSGAVIVALAHERPACSYYASDRSLKAVRLARNNARYNKVESHIRFFAANWMDALSADRASFDMVVSNPPYVSRDDIVKLASHIIRFEPISALDGGPEGMDHIKMIILEAHRYLKPKGLLLLEIGFDQREAVETTAHSFDAYDPPVFFKDYGGHDRVALLRKKAA